MVDIEEKRRGDILRFLQASQTMGETIWVREFRRWVRKNWANEGAIA